MTTEKKTQKIFFLILVSLAVFLYLKMQRGFTASDEQGGIWNVIQIIYVFLGIYFFVTIKHRYIQFPVIKFYMAFTLAMWFESFFSIIFTPNPNMGTLFNFLMVPYGFFCFIVFYWIGLKNDISKYPYILYITFLIITFILFKSMRNFYSYVLEDKGAVADVYYIVGLLPIIFIYTPKKLRIVPFLLASIAVMMTGKRTGFLALAVILVLYFLLPNGSRKSKTFFYGFFTSVVLLIISYLVITRLTDYFDLNMFERISHLGDDGGSGRMAIWSKILGALGSEDNFLRLLVGHGYGSVNKLVGIHAHNDFLELFYNYGIIVTFLYITFFIALIIECHKMYKKYFIYAKEFMVAIVVSLFLSLFSFYAIACTHITCCSASLGLILAEWYKFQNGMIYEQNRFGL